MSKESVVVTFHVDSQGQYISLGFAGESLISVDRLRYPISYGEAQTWSNWANRARWFTDTVSCFLADGWTCAVSLEQFPVPMRPSTYRGDPQRIIPNRFDDYVKLAEQFHYASPSIVR